MDEQHYHCINLCSVDNSIGFGGACPMKGQWFINQWFINCIALSNPFPAEVSKQRQQQQQQHRIKQAA